MQRWKLSYETQNILYDGIERNMKFEQEDREHIQRSDVAVNTCICLYICRAVFYFVSLLSSMLLFMCELNIFIVSSFKCALFSCASGTHVLMLAACMHIYTYSTRSHKHLNMNMNTLAQYIKPFLMIMLCFVTLFIHLRHYTHSHAYTLRWLIDIGHFNSNSSAI